MEPVVAGKPSTFFMETICKAAGLNANQVGRTRGSEGLENEGLMMSEERRGAGSLPDVNWGNSRDLTYLFLVHTIPHSRADVHSGRPA